MKMTADGGWWTDQSRALRSDLEVLVEVTLMALLTVWAAVAFAAFLVWEVVEFVIFTLGLAFHGWGEAEEEN